MCDEAWRLWMWHNEARGTDREQETLSAYLAHRLAHDDDPKCKISLAQALRIRDAGKVTIEGRWA